jgi:hypothetical protein
METLALYVVAATLGAMLFFAVGRSAHGFSGAPDRTSLACFCADSFPDITLP